MNLSRILRRWSKKYEEDVKKFYAAGKTSFLSSKTEGDIDTFYSNTIRFYMLQIAQTAFEKHKLGLGIFTMQGFERRNKESKNTFRRFTNKKGNTLLSNLKRLWDFFYYKNVAVWVLNNNSNKFFIIINIFFAIPFCRDRIWYKCC